MDLQSILGYSVNSPFRGNPYLDINTPTGLIDMSNTNIDLVGIDNLGNKKKMKAGRKNPYKFQGNTVREIPTAQAGGMPNPGLETEDGPTIKDALQNALNLKIHKNGNFKALIPLDDWNEDVMNYIDKYKSVNRKGNPYVKVRGKLEKPAPAPQEDEPIQYEMLRRGGYQQGGLWDTNRVGYVDSTLSANKNLDWVQRLYQKNPQTMQLPGQRYPSTHFMQSSDNEVYPTVVNMNGKLQYLGNNARGYADKTNTAIQFPTDSQAQWFGENYKIGTGVLPKQQLGGVPTYQNDEEIQKDTNFARNLLTRQNAPAYFINNSVVARMPGDPKVQFQYTNASMPDTSKRAVTLPRGVSVDQVFLNAQGQYGYIDPTYDNWVPVDPNSIYSLYGQKAAPQPINNSIAKMQRGGFSYRDLYNYLFQDDNYEEDSDNKNTAPSQEDVQKIEPPQQQQEPDDYEQVLNMAMQSDDLNILGRNPYGASPSAFLPQKVPGVNPYSGSAETPNPNNPSKYAFEFFKNKGLPAHVAAGIVGNLIQESGNFRPDVITDKIKGDNGTSHGIAQWHNDRWPQLQKWATSQGMNPNDLNTQLEYVYREANQRGDLQKTSTASTPEEAANIFAKYYERPAIIDKNRARNARNLYQQ